MSGADIRICGSSFWNSSILESSRPDFTFCFQYTILRWAPCFMVWILLSPWLYMVKRERKYKARYTWFTFSKFIVAVLLILIEVGHLVLAGINSSKNNIYPVHFLTPCFLIITYIIAIFLMFYEVKYGLRSSVLLFCFWGSLLLFSTFTFRTKIYEYQDLGDQIDYWDFILFYEYYGLLLVIFILTLFSEKMVDGQKSEKDTMKPFPEERASLVSRILFWWINPLIINGFKKELHKEDMWRIDEKESCAAMTERLEKEWNKAAQKYIAEKRREQEINRQEMTTSYQTLGQSDTTLPTNQYNVKFSSNIKEPSLAYCLTKIIAGKFLAGAFLKLIQDLLTFAGPVILDLLIGFTRDKNQSPIVGYFLAGLLFFCAFLQSISVQQYFHRMFIVGARLRTGLMGLVYKKSLRLSTKARKQATVGEMVNLMQVNTQSFIELMTYINMIWSAPLQIIICVAILWQYLGVASLAGLVTMVIFIPINAYLSNKSKILQTYKLKYQDSRIKLTNEILNGIKVLKLYGWEVSFRHLVEKIRDGELKVLLNYGIYGTVISFSWGAASFLIATASFIVYILIDENNNLDASIAFVSLSLFNIMRFPLIILPQVISSIVQANVSLTRIRGFLLRDEIDDSQIEHQNIPGQAALFDNVDLGWTDEDTTLHDLNFEVKSGELVAVVGVVGCGKSSLLNGFLGEMNKFKGRINVNGSLAYVPQQAWIQNSTLRDNILFGRSYDELYYNKVIEACALRTDLGILPAGDLTEIGEKGINLSGGQKQRISLARSLYSDADFFLLDDPLSAVDSHVGKHIFDHVIGPKGLLRHKTRVFATNSLSFLPECDRVILLENGRVTDIGTYKQLMKKKDAFTDFIGQYFLNNESNKDNFQSSSEEENNSKNGKSIKLEGRPPSPKNKNTNNVQEKAGEKIIAKEKVEVGKVKFSVLYNYFKSCTLTFSFIFIVFYVLMNVAQSATSLYLSSWSNNAENDSVSDRYVRLGVYTALGISQYLFMLFGDIAYLIMLMKSSRFLHSSMLASILRSTMAFFESTPTGRIINRFSKDIEAVETMIPTSYRMLIRMAFQVLITIIMISVQTPFFLIPLVPIAIIYIFVQRYYVAAMRQLRRLNSVSKSPIFSHFGETLTGITTIRAFNAQHRFEHEMEEKIDGNLIYYYPDTISNRWLAVRLEFIGNLVTLFASIFAVVGRDSLSPGAAGLSISYSLSISQILNWLVRMTAEFESNITSVERIEEYCETPHEAPWEIEESKPPNEWPQEGSVQFNGYSVKYREELDFVLRKIDCNILPGEKIGIVGRTGAGKSSLTLALFRILESNYGQIAIDGIDIKTLGLHDLRKKLTIIPQDPVLFSGTLRINLDPFGSYSDEKIWDALEHAHLKEFVELTDKQLEFECAEGGENLSVGQRQLVCLARALLRKTKILILDEATAAVDHNTDDLIQTTIRQEFADCTVLTIAHRLNTILDSSRVMVLDKGEIIEFDSPKALLSNKSTVFYSMAESAGIV